jgi:hypothetical protein
VSTYEALATRIDLNGLCDLLEMLHVRDSWRHAELFEADRQRDLAEQERAAKQAVRRVR